MNTKTLTPKNEKAVVNGKVEIPAQAPKPTAQTAEIAKEVEKEKVLQMIQKFKPEAPRTAEERIQLSKQFDELTKRFLHLKEKNNELAMFEAGNDKLQAKVTFENAQGFKFIIHNSNVIEVLKNCAKDELLILLSEADNEIMTFVM